MPIVGFFFYTQQVRGESYVIEDLEALVKSKQYAEACSHLLDIRPPQRTDQWKSLAIESVMGRVAQLQSSDLTCQNAWNLLQDMTDKIPALSESAKIQNVVVEVGVCYVKNGQFWEIKDKTRVAEKILAVKESAIYDLATKAGWDGYNNLLLLRYLQKNPGKYLKDESARDYVIHAAQTNYMDEPADLEKIKLDVLKKFNLHQKFIQTHRQKVEQHAQASLTQVNTTDETEVFNSMKNLEKYAEKIKSLQAAFYLPVLVSGRKDTRELLKKLSEVPKGDVQKTAKLLIAAKPVKPFWFTGHWSEEELAGVKTLVPELFELAKKECDAYVKNKLTPIHVVTHACGKSGALK